MGATWEGLGVSVGTKDTPWQRITKTKERLRKMT